MEVILDKTSFLKTLKSNGFDAHMTDGIPTVYTDAPMISATTKSIHKIKEAAGYDSSFSIKTSHLKAYKAQKESTEESNMTVDTEDNELLESEPVSDVLDNSATKKEPVSNDAPADDMAATVVDKSNNNEPFKFTEDNLFGNDFFSFDE